MASVGPMNIPFGQAAVPEFMAGFMFGMTGVQDNWNELKTCFQNTHQFYQELGNAWSHYKQEDYYEASEDMATIFEMLPSETTHCTDLIGFTTSVLAWGRIWKSKHELTELVGQNYAIHEDGIKTAIMAAERDCAAQRFFDCGLDVAVVMTDTVGPIPQPMFVNSNFDVHYARVLKKTDDPSLVGAIRGLTYRLLLVNDLLDFQRCVDYGHQTIGFAREAVDAFADGDSMQGMMYAGKATVSAFYNLEDCRDASNDGEFRAFVEWLDVLTSLRKLTDASTRGMNLNAVEIEYATKDAKLMLMGSWSRPNLEAGVNYDFGYALGDVCYWALGPITDPSGNYPAFTS